MIFAASSRNRRHRLAPGGGPGLALCRVVSAQCTDLAPSAFCLLSSDWPSCRLTSKGPTRPTGIGRAPPAVLARPPADVRGGGRGRHGAILQRAPPPRGRQRDRLLHLGCRWRSTGNGDERCSVEHARSGACSRAGEIGRGRARPGHARRPRAAPRHCHACDDRAAGSAAAAPRFSNVVLVSSRNSSDVFATRGGCSAASTAWQDSCNRPAERGRRDAHERQQA